MRSEYPLEAGPGRNQWTLGVIQGLVVTGQSKLTASRWRYTLDEVSLKEDSSWS